MSRPLRVHMPGTPYHIFGRGNRKECIFHDAIDNQRFLKLLGESADRFGASCVAFCLLWNHYHLIVYPAQIPISRMMQQLNSTYCQWFNRRHGRVGHVLQGRFGSLIIDNDTYLLTALRYLAMNPLVARLANALEDWPWSSYRATAGLEQPPAFLALDRVWKAFDAKDACEGRERYVAFVSAGAVDDALFKQFMLASDAFAHRVAPLLEPHREVGEYVYAHRFAARPPLYDILKEGTSRTALQAAAREAVLTHAYTLSEIGRMVGRAPSTVWGWVARGTRPRRPWQPDPNDGVRSRFFTSGFE